MIRRRAILAQLKLSSPQIKISFVVTFKFFERTLEHLFMIVTYYFPKSLRTRQRLHQRTMYTMREGNVPKSVRQG